jgi:DNA-binding response OmpR family regulator
VTESDPVLTGPGGAPPAEHGRILVVEDEAVNRLALERALRIRGHEVQAVVDGVEAMETLRARPFDLVLLDIILPRKDGFETLAEIKADPDLRELPVIVISGIEDTASVVRCIEMGALDHLPKPFAPALLDARIGAALSAKRLRDLEIEYLEQVGRLTRAAESLEADEFEPESLSAVVDRSDALGVLARSFVRMANEVRAREDALRLQVRELTIEIDDARQARRVAEITDSDYFRTLRGRAEELRRTAHGGNEPREPES